MRHDVKHMGRQIEGIVPPADIEHAGRVAAQVAQLGYI